MAGKFLIAHEGVIWFSGLDKHAIALQFASTGKIREFPMSWNWGYFGSNLGLTWV